MKLLADKRTHNLKITPGSEICKSILVPLPSGGNHGRYGNCVVVVSTLYPLIGSNSMLEHFDINILWGRRHETEP